MAIFYHILSFVPKMLALIQLHIIFTPAKRKHPAHCPPTIHHTHTMLRCWQRWHRNKEGTFHSPHLISSSLKLASPLARPINKGACLGFAWVGKSEENKEVREAFFFFFFSFLAAPKTNGRSQARDQICTASEKMPDP